jgi:hypothetical protein
VRAVIDESYANGEISSVNGVKYLELGKQWVGKVFEIAELAQAAGINPSSTYYKKACTLTGGTPFPAGWDDAGTWRLYLVGAPEATALNADGFCYVSFPDGNVSSKPVIIVTYKLDRVPNAVKMVDVTDASKNADIYNPQAGFEIYPDLVR